MDVAAEAGPRKTDVARPTKRCAGDAGEYEPRGRTIPGVGFGITVLLIYLTGLMAGNIVGKKLIQWSEVLMAKLPVFRHLYTGSKQILESFSAPRQTGFMQVVLVEYPRRGLRSVGFITNELPTHSGEKMFTIFIPTAPNPTGSEQAPHR